jgi:hypothetical protein
MLGRSVNGSVVANAVSPFVNLPPIADAGPDKTVQGRGPFVPVPLSGTATDPRGGSVLSADWRENGNVVAQGLNATAMLAPGKHTLTLRVFDTWGAQGVDTVVVDVAPGFTIGPPAISSSTTSARTSTRLAPSAERSTWPTAPTGCSPSKR